MKGGFFREGQYRYIDTGEIFKGTPARLVFGGPLGIIYYAPDGREIRPIGS